MKTKKFVGAITIILTLLCLYRLAFTFMAISIEKKAENYAQDENGGINFDKKQNFLKSIWKKPMYNFLGIDFTYEEIKESELCLGLDLQGGMYVNLELSIYDLLKSFTTKITENFYLALNKAQERTEKNTNKNFETCFYEEYRKLDHTPLYIVFDKLSNKLNPNLELSDDEVLKILSREIDQAIDRSYDIIMSRIDKFGTSQPNIQRITDTNRIQIELPGVTNPERVRQILQGVARLGFWEVYTREEIRPYLEELFEKSQHDDYLKDDVKTFFEMMKNDLFLFELNDWDRARDILKKIENLNVFPTNLKWCWDAKPKQFTNDGKFYVHVYPIKSNNIGEPALEGSSISYANVDSNQMGKRIVQMQIDSNGTKTWKELTAKNIGRPIAVTLDDKVYSAPIVNSEIPSGQCSIEGNFSIEEAQDLTNVLKAGALPAPAKIVEEAIVGPTLGKDSQNKASASMFVTIIVIGFFMLIYYARSGMVAICALLLNLLFIFGILSQLGTSLSMAGIAGLVLTVGMSIDANVIIFEKIREELRKGKHIKEAIKEGYRKSFSSIFDSNITTFLVGAIMYVLGQGPVKGFATTLMVGIITSFFTSVYLTQFVFEVFLGKKRIPEMSFYFNWSKNILTKSNINFIRASRYSWIVSASIIIIGFFLIIFKSALNFGVDFTGGRSAVISFGQYVQPEQFRSILTEAMDNATSEVKHYGSTNSLKVTTGYLLDKDEETAAPIIKKKLIESIEKSTNFVYSGDNSYNLSDNEFVISNTTKVGPSVANSVKNSAISATLFSCFMIFCYIFVRFRKWQLGVGALVALVHDILMVFAIFGILSIFGFSLEVDQIFLASILTIIGYSINDTVIIFDRYREVAKTSTDNLLNCVNTAINSTLSRTIITSATTLFAVIVLLIFGGEAIRSFSVAMLIGVVFGTYSSIFVALPLAYRFSKK